MHEHESVFFFVRKKNLFPFSPFVCSLSPSYNTIECDAVVYVYERIWVDGSHHHKIERSINNGEWQEHHHREKLQFSLPDKAITVIGVIIKLYHTLSVTTHNQAILLEL